MTQVGRNEPCPCGSGKKYKKCCITKAAPASTAESAVKGQIMTLDEMNDDLERLDMLSNSVIQLIRESQFGKAEEACKELLRLYPDQVDGLERYAMVHEAIGDKDKAREYYEKTITFMKTHEGFDSDSVAWVIERMNRL